MSEALILPLLALAAVGSLVFSALAYALRDYSRGTLAEWFERKSRSGSDAKGKIVPGEAALARVEAVADYEDELALTAAAARTAANLIIVLAIVFLVGAWMPPATEPWVRYVIAFVASFITIGLFGVALPLAVGSHAAESTIGTFARLLRIKRAALWPLIQAHGPIDRLVRRATGRPEESAELVEEELEQEILDIVREGREEGVIGEGEHQMIERAVHFHDMTVEQALTPRGDVVGLPVDSSADEVLQVIEDTGYSRIPVYEDNLDHVVGVLYARDLFQYVGKRLNGQDSEDRQTRRFDLRTVVRKPIVVPESKRLDDLLRDMQQQKIHMAIVLDEYGGTSGLVTIEDILEELVGEIADEHEDPDNDLFRKISDTSAEADAKMAVDDLNREMGIHLPEDDEYDTLAGFVNSTLHRIPPVGTSFEHATGNGSRYVFTILEAEPQRVGRLRIEVQPEPDATDEAE
ncbi:MAG: hemolysin family protein [Planctomycetota bacterium]